MSAAAERRWLKLCRRIGRRTLEIDPGAILRDRLRRMSLSQVAKAHGISRALVSRVIKDAGLAGQLPRHEGSLPAPLQV